MSQTSLKPPVAEDIKAMLKNIKVVFGDKSLYSILEVDVGSSVEGIKKSYYAMAKMHHPDKNLSDNFQSNLVIQALNLIKEILLDSAARPIYDKMLRCDYQEESDNDSDYSNPSAFFRGQASHDEDFNPNTSCSTESDLLEEVDDPEMLTMRQKILFLEEQLLGANLRISCQTRRANAAEKEVNNLLFRLSTQERRATIAEAEVIDLSTQLASQEERVIAAETKVKKLENHLTSQKNRTTTAEDKVKHLLTQIDSQTHRASKAEGEMTQLKKKMIYHARRADVAEAKVKKLKSQLTLHKHQSTTAMDEVKTLKSELTRQKYRATVAKAKVVELRSQLALQAKAEAEGKKKMNQKSSKSEGTSVENKCHECQKILSSKNKLKLHLRTHDKTQQSYFFCDICPAKYSVRSRLNQHCKKEH